MKRIGLLVITVFLSTWSCLADSLKHVNVQIKDHDSSVYLNNDLHLKQMIECINSCNYSCALEHLSLVKVWIFDSRFQIDDVNKYKAFILYLKGESNDSAILQHFCDYYRNELEYTHKLYFDNKNYKMALYYAQLEKGLELLEKGSLGEKNLDAFIILQMLQ